MRPRYLYLLIASVLALLYSAMSPCSADLTSNTAITAAVPSSLTINAPADITDWVLDPDTDNEKKYDPAAGGKLRGASNNQWGFQVTAVDNDNTKGSYMGYMLSGTPGSGTYLANYLRMALWTPDYTGTATEVSLNSQTPRIVINIGSRGEIIKYVSWKNLGSWNDDPTKSYSIVVKFAISNYPHHVQPADPYQ